MHSGLHSGGWGVCLHARQSRDADTYPDADAYTYTNTHTYTNTQTLVPVLVTAEGEVFSRGMHAGRAGCRFGGGPCQASDGPLG